VGDGTDTSRDCTEPGERLCWQAARRDDVRVAQRLYHRQVVDGVYRLDNLHGMAIQRVIVPCIQYVLLYRLKTLYGVGRMNALPALLFT
jgi:hypothetical protein